MARRRNGLVVSVAIPFALAVVLGSVFLLAVWAREAAKRSVRLLERSAESNARFLGDSRITPDPALARRLGVILGCGVYLRESGAFVGETPSAVWGPEVARAAEGLAADGVARRMPGQRVLAVAVGVGSGSDLVFIQPALGWWELTRGWPVLGSLLVFWLLATALALQVYRALVAPLKALQIGVARMGEAETPHLDRPDEIGDVARAFDEAQSRLREERTARLRAERLAVLGKMAASLAHEVHNPLSVVQMHADLAAARSGDDESLRWIRKSAARIGSIVNRWLYMAVPEPAAEERVAVTELIAGALGALGVEPGGVKVLPPHDTLPEVRVDRRRLEEALANVIRNAVEASAGESGEVEIACSSSGGRVRIAVSDRGTGFDRESIHRATEAFWSGKSGGTGIGLSMAREVVVAIGGRLELSNRDGGGAIVVIDLPTI